MLQEDCLQYCFGTAVIVLVCVNASISELEPSLHQNVYSSRTVLMLNINMLKENSIEFQLVCHYDVKKQMNNVKHISHFAYYPESPTHLLAKVGLFIDLKIVLYCFQGYEEHRFLHFFFTFCFN